jgi:carboxymethylenebutenolidase
MLQRLRTMRITLPSGTPAEIDLSVTNPVMGLVIMPDIFGLRPLFDELVARLAREWQMAVIAIEPFADQTLSADIAERMAVMPSLNDDEILRDMHEAADALGIDRVGLMGFCMGGMYCHKAARSDRFARISSFYGMIHIPEGWMSATQGDPLAYLEGGNADRVLAIIGSLDPYTPPDQVMELRAVGVTVQEYPEAVHGFAHDAARPAHRVDDAQDAFSRTRDWLLTS